MKRSVLSFFTCFLLFISSAQVDAQSKEVVCYMAAWVSDLADKIDPKLCSSIVIAFADINLDGTITAPANIYSFLKLKSPTTKLLISLGGGNSGLQVWKAVAATPESRSKFAIECVLLCRQFDLDGVDTDWEFPDSDERDLFTELHKDLAEVLHLFDLKLTMAIGVGNWPINVKNIYDFPELSKHVDAIHMMTYNIHMDEPWDIVSGVNFNAPKSATKGESIEYGLKLVLSKEAWKEKLIVGLPFYARTYKLEDPSRKEIGSPFVVSYQSSDPPNNIPAYNKYCQRLFDPTWTKMWDNETSSPYMFKDDLWTSYEDVDSIAAKAELSIQYDIGGVMIWTIHQDDIEGDCGERQALLKSANIAVGREIV